MARLWRGIQSIMLQGNIILPGRYEGESIHGTSFCGLSLVILVFLSHTQQNTKNPTASPACMNATGCQKWPRANSLRTVYVQGKFCEIICID